MRSLFCFFFLTAALALGQSSATYSGTDPVTTGGTGTQGAWTGKYGVDGYQIVNGTSNVPSYATVSMSGGITYTWAGETTDPRALQTAAGSATGIAAAYNTDTTNSFNIGLTLTGGASHVVALYLLDWDTTARSETITVYDASGGSTNGNLLSTQTFTGFHNGVWALWTIQGSVKITVTTNNSSAGVVSGVFFGSAAGTGTGTGSGSGSGSGSGTVTATASFSETDTTTKGNWTDVYGMDGYQIVNGNNHLPGYANVTFSQGFEYTWADQTSDSRALQVAAGANTYMASAYNTSTSNTFNINVNLTDGNSHTVALYLLDWDTTTRVESITIVSSSSTVLSTQTFSKFNGGVWAVWVVKGSVTFQVTTSTSAAAVVSGIFFSPGTSVSSGSPGGSGPAPTQPTVTAKASYNKTDTASQGTWTGTYGADGYQIIDGTSSLPSYASVTLGQGIYYTWAADTDDPRALQTAAGADTRIAAAYNSNNSSTFTIGVNLTDGNSHTVALYLLDWDTTTRVESVTIVDGSNTVLSTQNFSGFNGGIWASWVVTGNVTFKVTTSTASAAVVSGLFFGPPPVVTPPPTNPTPPPSNPAPPAAVTSAATNYIADTTTSGAWSSKYGSDGYEIVSGPAYLPGYATAAFSGGIPFTWANATSDPRAPQVSPGGIGMASAYNSNATSSFSIKLDLGNDGISHTVALYLLDWDTTARVETIAITDTATGTPLDTETVSGFSQGVYAVWTIKGSVTIQVTTDNSSAAVVSGIFLGPAAAASYTGPPPPVSTISGSAIYAPASGSAGNVANFTTDYYFSGGGTDNFQSSSQPPAVDTSEASTDGYQSLYQNDRYGTFSYTLPNLTPGEYYTLNLHFAEIQFASASQRQFNVSINNTPYLSNFDIVADAGAANRATVKSYRVTPDATGKILVSFTPGNASTPKLSGLELFAPLTVSSGTASASATVVSQIAAGRSAAAGSFSADAAYAGGTTGAYSSAIDVSGVNNPAPAAVYQAERSGRFSYTLPNLAAGQVYTVRLHFAENVYSTPGQRQFNVLINNAQVLTNFDIFAAAGAANRALVRAFAAVPNSSGQIVVSFTSGSAGAPKVSGIELVTGVRISSSGAGASYWEADQCYNGGGTFSQTGVSIDTSGVASPAPQAVYENNRYGYTTYTIPNLSPNTAYQLNLHFAETSATAAGQRKFDVSVNGTPMLNDFDIFAQAGAANRAVVAPLSVTASSAGQIIVHLTPGSVNGPIISGLELLQAGSTATQVTISGTVTTGSSPLAGVLLTLSGGQSGTYTTGSNGSYSFTVPLGRSYTVTASLAGYTFTAATNPNLSNLMGNSLVSFLATTAAGSNTANDHLSCYLRPDHRCKSFP